MKRYLVVALGVVSVLLGSLLYSSLVLAGDLSPSGKPQTPTVYKDSLRINILSVTSSGWEGQGAFLGPEEAGEVTNQNDFPFIFKPEETLQNITNLWYSFLYVGGPQTVEVALNGIYVTSHSLYGSAKPVYVSFQVTDTNIYSVLESGINILVLTQVGYTSGLRLQDLILFIEYEYQA